MKKILSLLTAFAMSAMTFAQTASVSSGENPAKPQFVHSKRVLKTAQPATVATGASTLIERSVSTMGYYSCNDGVEVAFPGDNVITITNLQGYGTTLTGTVDWEHGTVEFPTQLLTTATTLDMDDQGNETLVDVEVMFSGDSIPSPVTGTVTPEGVVTLNAWIGETFFPDWGWDWTYNLDMNSSTFLTPNAKMKTTALNGTETEYNVHLEYNEDNSRLLVSNFGGKAGIIVDVRSSGDLAIQSGQYFYFQNFYLGYASIYYPLYNGDKVEGVNSIRYIRGNATENEMNIGEWIVCFDISTTTPRPEWATTSTVITRTDGGKFLFPEPGQYGWQGKGTSQSPFLINSAQDFERLASYVDQGVYFDGTYFKMTNDIDFSHSPFRGVATGMETTVNTNPRFEGYLDGAGYAIKNLNLNLPEFNHVALFGELRGTVRNLVIDASCRFVGRSYVGSIAGDMKTTTDAKIINCSNFAPVTGSDAQVGGLAGQMAYGHELTDSYNAGDVTSYNCKVGGLVGYLFRATVRNSQNDGRVAIVNAIDNNPLLAQAGGIAGYVCGATVDNCLNTGTITAAAKCGGLLGEVYNNIFVTKVTNSVNLGAVLSGTNTQQGAIVAYGKAVEPEMSNDYYDAQKMYVGAVENSSYNGVNASLTSELISGSLALPSRYWNQEAGKYPVLKKFADASVFGEEGRECYILFAENESTADFTSVQIPENVEAELANGTEFQLADGVLTAPSFILATATDTLTITTGEYTTVLPLRLESKYTLAGKGTASNPYRISDVYGWYAFVRMTDVEKSDFKKEYVVLDADLDFTGLTYQIPLHSANHMFEGSFDGQGHTISGVHLDLGNNGSAGTKYQGVVISALGPNGVLKNLTVDNCSISGFEYIGGIVGECAGTIQNCHTTSNVTVLADNRYAGGIAGTIIDSGKLIECTNGASVWSESYVGGMAGDGFYAVGSSIQSCVNNGAITNDREGRPGVSYVAGFVPRYKGTISNSVNNGSVTSINSLAAGFVNVCYNDTKLQSCVNNGTVIAVADMMVSGEAGGIANDGAGTITDCGNTGEVRSYLNYSGGIVTTANSTIRGCWNTGFVASRNVNAGGIAGQATGTVQFIDCWNTGEVAAGYEGMPATESDNAGGIVGKGSVILDGCWNAGYIHVDKIPGDDGTADYDANFDFTNAGGLVGLGGLTLTNCFNVGKVESLKHTGGLIGQLFYGEERTVRISNSYNAGPVVNTSDNDQEYASHIVGGHADEGVVVSNVYYDYEADDYSYPEDEEHYDACAMSHADMLSARSNIIALGDAYDFSNAATYPQLKRQAGNKAHSVATAAIMLQDNGSYMLSKQSDDASLDGGLVWTATGGLAIQGNYAVPVAAGEAVLTVSCPGTDFTKSFAVEVTEGQINGISELTSPSVSAPVFYNVNGQRVSSLKGKGVNGVVVVNGKKMVVK